MRDPDDPGDPRDLQGDDGEARLLTTGETLTVRLHRAFTRSTIVSLVCANSEERKGLAVRSVVVRRGQRVVTADIGPVRSDANFCLIEDDLHFGDIAVALLGPPAPGQAN